LWFDEQHHGRPRLAHASERVDDQPQRDEGEIADDQVDATADRRCVEVTNVGALQIRDAPIGSQPLMELAVADVDRDDVDCATLEQAIGETTRRRSGVERASSGHVDAKRVECVVELEAAAPDEASRRCGDVHLVSGRDLARRLLGHCAIDQHAVLVDEVLRRGTAVDQAAPNQVDVEPAASAHAATVSPSVMC
jgi:hypothetical protein